MITIAVIDYHTNKPAEGGATALDLTNGFSSRLDCGDIKALRKVTYATAAARCSIMDGLDARGLGLHTACLRGSLGSQRSERCKFHQEQLHVMLDATLQQLRPRLES